MIDFGMRCHDICAKLPYTEVLDHVQALGVTNIQLAFAKSISDYDFSYGHYSAGFARYLKAELDKRDIHVAVLGCYINPTNPNEAKREEAVAKFIEHLRYARHMGADMVGTETGRYSENFQVVPQTRSEECYQTLLKSFRPIVRAAEQIGATVGVEGVFDHTLYSPQMMRRFLEDIDSENVEVILDAVNLIHPTYEFDPAAQRQVIDEAFSLYGNRISVLHLKDFVFEGEKQLYRHPGEGHFDYACLMEHVHKEKPHIIGLLENSSPQDYAADCQYLSARYEEAKR